MRRLFAVVLALTTGCSAIFMERVPDSYRARDLRPSCSGTKGFAAWDGVAGAAWLITSAALLLSTNNAADDGESQTGDDESHAGTYVVAAGGVLASIVHFSFANAGNSWANECRKARRDREVYELNLARAANPIPSATKAVTPEPGKSAYAAPGFWCAGAFCNKDKSACEHPMPGTSVACEHVNVAYCFANTSGPMCSRDQSSCAARQDANKATATSECVEAK